MSDYTNPLFADRHIGPDSAAVATMLEVIGVDSLDELARRALPAEILDALTASGAVVQRVNAQAQTPNSKRRETRINHDPPCSRRALHRETQRARPCSPRS